MILWSWYSYTLSDCSINVSYACRLDGVIMVIFIVSQILIFLWDFKSLNWLYFAHWFHKVIHTPSHDQQENLTGHNSFMIASSFNLFDLMSTSTQTVTSWCYHVKGIICVFVKSLVSSCVWWNYLIRYAFLHHGANKI